jgi:hypothetical protein
LTRVLGLRVWQVKFGFFVFFSWFSSQIRSFNIWFIWNYTLSFLFICFLWGYFVLLLGSRVWRVNPGWLVYSFVSFIYLIFFQFHPSTLDLLGIELHNLFWFTLYEVIPVTWTKLWVWRVNLGWLKLFVYWSFFNWIFFFQFHLSTLDWWGIEFHNLFWFSFY